MADTSDTRVILDQIEKEPEPRGRSWFIALGLGGGAALLAFILSVAPPLAVFENYSRDIRFQLRGPVDRAGSSVFIVYFDEEALDFYEESFGRWPWKREIHAELIHYIASGKPRVIAYDGFFYEPDILDPESDALLVRATGEAGVVHHAFTLDRRGSLPTEAMKKHSVEVAVDDNLVHLFPTDNGANLPLPGIVEGAAGLGIVNFLADRDGYNRNRLIYPSQYPHF